MIDWVQLLSGGGLSAGAIIVVLLYLFRHPDKFEHWMAIFYKVLYGLSSSLPKLRRKIDRRVVASSIQDAVNGVCEQINKQSPDIFPHALKIEWVQSETSESFIRKGEAIVRLRHFENQDRNIVESTLLYLKAGLLPRSKHYLDKTLRESCEFKFATQVFLSKRDTGAYDYFLENVLDLVAKTDINFQRDIQMLEDLDSVGYFARVFLTEVKLAAEKLLGAMPTPAIQQELRNFALFLQIIANKAEHERVPLGFRGVKVKAAVILVAKRETIQLYGIDPYLNRISRCVQDEYDSVYISGWGEEFVGRVIDIKNAVRDSVVTVLRSYTYLVRGQVKGILLVCQSNLQHLAQKKELYEEVSQALAEIVPGVKTGEIELASIGRIKDVGCKIAVRARADEDPSEATGACIGTGGERVAALRNRFPKEFVAIVPWSADTKEFLVNALTPLKASQVETVEIDEEDLVATVKVATEEAYARALGKKGNNVKVASALTGWLINIRGPSRAKTMPTPDEELRKTLIDQIPELRDEIEIVRLARIKGVGSRVIVKWKTDKKDRTRKMASQVCRGLYNERLKAIQQETQGEWIYFHEWSDDRREEIIGCLYPLRESDVEAINLDDGSNTAIITLRRYVRESPPMWRSQYNLALSERVTGWRIEVKESSGS